MKKITQCRVCKSSDLFSYLYLGEVPPANKLGSTDKFPIEVYVCEDCYLSQLSVVVDPNILYSDYPYHSSVSETFKKHCYDLAVSLMDQFPTWKYPLVVDIAANDGCLLSEFRRAGFNRLLGVEPSDNLASECVRNRILCANNFWSEEFARGHFPHSNEHNASFIIAQNVLGHVDDLEDFIKGVEFALDPDGVFVAEFPYMVDLVQKNEFDTIYHEHLSYFLLNPLNNLFASLGLPIFKVERLPIHGGSLRIYASKNVYPDDGSVGELLNLEKEEGFYRLTTYVSFANRVFSLGAKLIEELELLKDKKIIGYGASAKGISLINYFGLERYIHSIVDDTPDKQGKRTPGSNLPIVDFSHFEKEKPDYIILLAWNFVDELMSKTKHLDAKYIIPIPEVKIV